MFGLSKRSTRLGSCCCAQLTERPRQVKQIVGNQRTPLNVVKHRFACKANYGDPTIQSGKNNRPSLSVFVWTSVSKSSTQIRGTGRGSDTAVQNIVGRNRPTIIMLIRALACSDHSALQRSADEKAFRFAVGINGRSWCHIGLGSTSHRSRSNTRVRPKRHIPALRKSANSALGVKHDYKIGHLRADLRPPTRAAGANE